MIFNTVKKTLFSTFLAFSTNADFNENIENTENQHMPQLMQLMKLIKINSSHKP